MENVHEAVNPFVVSQQIFCCCFFCFNVRLFIFLYVVHRFLCAANYFDYDANTNRKLFQIELFLTNKWIEWMKYPHEWMNNMKLSKIQTDMYLSE